MDDATETDDARASDAAGLDASVLPGTDAGEPDGGPPVVHPGTGTWSACIPDAVNRICYFVPGAVAALGADITLMQRIAIDATTGRISESGSLPPFDLNVSPMNVVGEHLNAASISTGGGVYLDFEFLMGTSQDGWAACNPSTRRFRILRAGTTGVAFEFELDCTAMPGVQIRGAVQGDTSFAGWRTDPIDGL